MGNETEEKKRNKQQIFTEKELQTEMPKQYSGEDSAWLKCNTDPSKTLLIFALKEQMIETRAWKTIRVLVEFDK